MGRTSFTPEMDQFLIENYMEIPAKRMARMIGKSEFGTMNRMRILGISAPAHKKEEWKMAGLKKGHGWNKGLCGDDYLTHEAKRGMAKTQFKKGNLPHNTRADGDLSLRSDGYIWVRIDKAKWELLHRVIYARHHEVTLKTEDNIIFLDGNRTNFDISNLKLVSNEELMSMNTIHNYPEDLVSAIKALSKLKRKIKQYEKQD